MTRHSVILAADIFEGNSYAKSVGLAPFSYRVAVSKEQVHGLSGVDVHVLPGFESRRDRHAILAELRYAHDVTRIVVGKWEPLPADPVDQGDGMGPQLTIFDALKEAESGPEARAPEPSEDPAPPAPAAKPAARPKAKRTASKADRLADRSVPAAPTRPSPIEMF